MTHNASEAAPDRQIVFIYSCSDVGGPSGPSQTSPQGRGADGPALRPFSRWRRHEVQTGRAGLLSASSMATAIYQGKALTMPSLLSSSPIELTVSASFIPLLFPLASTSIFDFYTNTQLEIIAS